MWLLSLLLFLSPSDRVDDRRGLLYDAITAYTEPLDLTWDSTRVRVAWADLNGDDRDEAIVYLAGEAWCGSGGCTVLVFEAMDEIDAEEFGPYRPAAEISLMHGPVRVVPSDGFWADLVVQAEDGTTRCLRFNGETYPMSPASGIIMDEAPEGAVLFADAE